MPSISHTWLAQWRFFSRVILDFIYPPICVLCENELGENEELVCRTCMEILPRLDEPVAASSHLAHQLSGPAWFTSSIALYPFQESIQKLIHLFKYKGYRVLAKPLGKELAQLLTTCGARPDALIPVPLHRRRLAERGYNQSLLLAQQVATATGLPIYPELLIRTRYTSPQAKLSKKERSRNLADAFQVNEATLAQGMRVMLVDDIFTTGHTLNECAKTLLNAGAAEVACLTLVRV